MTYKAIFIDVDDTLVVHGVDNLPSRRVTQAVSACEKRGVVVCLATSRPLNAAKNVLDHLNAQGLCILNGGTQIYDASKHKIIREHYVPAPAISRVLRYASKKKFKMGYFDGADNIELSKKELPKSADKIVGLYMPEIPLVRMDEIEKDLQSIAGIAVHKMYSWDKKHGWIDVTNSNATKLHGIYEVIKLLGMDTKEIIGVGDGYNDFPLLMACGLKIAMGNAVPELKAIADFVAPTVVDDGVATVIEKFILKR